MANGDERVDDLLRTLQERAKELTCLYRVNELLNQPGTTDAETFRAIAAALPQGWQYPELCECRIVYEGRVFAPHAFEPSPWVQSAPITTGGRDVGAVEVYYREQIPDADEGPFLKEERKLIGTVADWIGSAIASRDQKSALTHRGAPDPGGREWRTVLDFMRQTDTALLLRISRKMINHLASSGVAEAQALLARFSPRATDADWDTEDENRPLPRGLAAGAVDIEAFEIAERNLNEREILACLTKWIKEEKAGFLVRALEGQEVPLGDICDAVERFEHADVEEQDLSLSVQKGLRVSLCRRFFSEDLEFINVAKEVIDVRDFYPLVGRVILPSHCYGKLGGKSAGLVLAKKIVEKSGNAQLLGNVKLPRTWYIPSDGILEFIHYNNLEDVLSRKYMEIDQIRQDYPHLVQLFKSSAFPPAMAKGLAIALEDFGTHPIIVRSSSLLEDRAGSAFSGKYKSLFLGNQGTKAERLAALMDAIAEVYASVFGPDPTEYRAERGLLDVHEEMGILMMEVVGRRAGRYFLPAYSGVAFSNNEFRWSPRIRREDGLIRLVPGLGTRAVDRIGDDYPTLIAPGQPHLRANVTPDEILKYSPKKIDVINLERNEFETIEIQDLLREAGDEYPMLRQLVSVVDGDRIRAPLGARVDAAPEEIVFTFDGLIRNTPFVSMIRELMSVIRAKLGSPVDVEFASDGQDFYLLQCRPQSHGSDISPSQIPLDLSPERIIFSANRYVSNGRVPEITHVVYVDADAYAELADADLREVGRAVGRLNKLLPRRQFVLIGPGRWGSRGDIRLGVPVTYSDINNSAMLIEVAHKRGNVAPDLSFGTHFFQDLVEASIRYLPLYPDDEGAVFNRRFLTGAHNMLPELLPAMAHLADTVKVIDVAREANGLVLRVLANAELERAVAFLSPPRPAAASAAAGLGGVGTDDAVPTAPPRAIEDHARWRSRMAQRMAAHLDRDRFGVVGVYLIGSAKSETAGATSDIDLVIHFRGRAEQRAALVLWLEAWNQALAEMNYLRSGHRVDHIIDAHIVTDDDIARGDSYASKINAPTDSARKL
jgi:predicted nucleotidyltransferase